VTISRRLALVGTASALVLYGTLGVNGSQTTQSPPAPAGNGAISGVVSDASNNRPLRGVVVSLTGGGVSRRTISDSKGRFVFSDLPPDDRYIIQASKPGYVAGGLAAGNPLGGLTRLPLADGEWIPDANFVMERLGAISGRVVDEAGEPVVKIPVRVLTRVPVAGTMRLASGPAALTDDRGVYRVAGLVAGSYIVAVQSVQSVLPPNTSAATAAGFSPMMVSLGNRRVPQSTGLDVGDSWLVIGQYATPPAPIAGQPNVYPPLFFANARSIANATAVHVANGEEKRNIDFSLQAVRGSLLSGRVTGPPHVLAGLVLRLLPEGTEALTSGFEQATALVRPDGTFTMVGVPPGRYTLVARTTVSGMTFSGHVLGPPVVTSTPGMVSMGNVTASFSRIESTVGFVGVGFGTRYTTGHEAYSGRLVVTVGPTDVSNLVVSLARGVRISGRVVREDGALLPDKLLVSVEPADGDPVLAGPPADMTVATNPAGTFSIEGLQAGAYFLRVTRLVKSITADGDYTNRPFDTTSGSDITDVVITIADKPATLSGVVRDRQGTAIREGAVILFPAGRELWTRFGVDPPRIRVGTYFGTRGYQMTLPGGEYYAIAVELSQRHAWHDPRFFAAAAPLATRVTLAWGVQAVQDLTLRQVVIK
jgi:hypothetical protein